MKRLIIIICCAFLLTGCGFSNRTPMTEKVSTHPTSNPISVTTTIEPTTDSTRAAEYIQEIINTDRTDSQRENRYNDYLDLLESVSPDEAKIWRRVLAYYDTYKDGVSSGVVADGFAMDDSLCIVTLGFELNADGTMADELINRLEVTLTSAKKYPNAYVLVTGGGTAPGKPECTEADEMCKWLVANGVDSERIIVENRSFSTRQNATYSFKILRERYPMVHDIAIISSDYHVPSAAVIFYAVALYEAFRSGMPEFHIVGKTSSPPAIVIGEDDFEKMYMKELLSEIIMS